MGAPGLVDGKGGAGRVSGGGDRADVRQDADEVRFDEQDGSGIGAGERGRDALRGNREREARHGIHLGAYPHRVEPREDEPCEERLVQVARDHHPPGAVAGDGQGERFVALRRAVDAEAAEIRAPELGGEALRPAEQVAAQVEVVGSRRQRKVEPEQRVCELGRALVAGRRERRDRWIGEELGDRVGEWGVGLAHGDARVRRSSGHTPGICVRRRRRARARGLPEGPTRAGPPRDASRINERSGCTCSRRPHADG